MYIRADLGQLGYGFGCGGRLEWGEGIVGVGGASFGGWG